MGYLHEKVMERKEQLFYYLEKQELISFRTEEWSLEDLEELFKKGNR